MKIFLSRMVRHYQPSMNNIIINYVNNSPITNWQTKILKKMNLQSNNNVLKWKLPDELPGQKDVLFLLMNNIETRYVYRYIKYAMFHLKQSALLQFYC